MTRPRRQPSTSTGVRWPSALWRWAQCGVVLKVSMKSACAACTASNVRACSNRDNPPQDEELRHLWELADGSQRLKKSFIKEAMRDLDSYKGIFQRRDYVAQAVWGIDPH